MKSIKSKQINSVLAALFAFSAYAASSQPNIVFILADDLGYADVGFMGQQKIKTPRLDALAKQGLVFNNMYAGGAVCGPSRATLMTGMSQDIGFIKGNPGGKMERENFRAEDVLFSELLQDSGYENIYLGKWGLGPQGESGYPLNKGYDYFVGYGTHKDAWNYYPKTLCQNDSQLAVVKGTYAPDIFLEEALAFLDKKHEKPFLLFMGFTLPHAPYDPPDSAPYENEPWDDKAKKYAAMVSRMDRDVGALLDTLKVRSLAGNTLVIFTSDNGVAPYGKGAPDFFNSNGDLRGIKRDVFDGGIKVPFIACWPGHIAPGRSDYVASFQDMMPTLCEIAGIKPSKTTNGISFVPTLLGRGEQKKHDFLYWEHIQMRGDGMGRQGVLDVENNMKAVRFGRHDNVRLYDLNADPSEANNIAKQQPEKTEFMKNKIETMRGASELWPLSMHDKGFKRPKE